MSRNALTMNHVRRHEQLEHQRHLQEEAQRASQRSAAESLARQQQARAVTVAALREEVKDAS